MSEILKNLKHLRMKSKLSVFDCSLIDLGKINFEESDLATSAGAFLIVILMPLTFSITNGIAAGFMVYTIIKVAKKEFKDLSFGILVITFVSALAFIF